MLADTHTHSQHSHDSSCPIADMALSQKAKGINAFCVTDHFDIPFLHEWEPEYHIKKSFEDVKSTSVEGIEILAGVEFSEAHWNMPEVERIIRTIPFDEIICSVHSFNRGTAQMIMAIDFRKLSETELYDLVNEYFSDLRQALEMDCDILAHLTLLNRYLTRQGIAYDFRKNEKQICIVLEHIIKNDIALEINCSSIDDGILMPDEHFIKKYIELGGKRFTLASDAHVKENAGKGLEQAKELLSSLNIKTAFYYKNRKPIEYEL